MDERDPYGLKKAASEIEALSRTSARPGKPSKSNLRIALEMTLATLLLVVLIGGAMWFVKTSLGSMNGGSSSPTPGPAPIIHSSTPGAPISGNADLAYVNECLDARSPDIEATIQRLGQSDAVSALNERYKTLVLLADDAKNFEYRTNPNAVRPVEYCDDVETLFVDLHALVALEASAQPTPTSS